MGIFLESRFAIMEKRQNVGQIQLVIMDWVEGQVITLYLDEYKEATIAPQLQKFLEHNLDIIKSKDWRTLN